MIKPCLHCGNDTKKITEEFCCLGCLSAYKIINKLGFKDYYNLRKIDPEIRKIKPENEEKIDISEFAFDNGNNVFSISLIVQGIHCAACIWLIESILKKQKNVLVARINLSKKSLFLKWQGNKDAGNELVNLISDIGYKLLPFDEKILSIEEKKYDNTILKALSVAGFGVGNIMLFSVVLWFSNEETMGVNTRNLMHFFSALIALPVIIYSARPFFLSAAKSIKSGYPNMDLAISIAIFLACVVSLLETFRSAVHVYFDSAVMLIFFLLIGRYLDLKARKKAFAIASEFTMLSASFGRVEFADGKIKILPVKDLKPDMILIVAAGEKIAADGVIIYGNSEIDSSIINGETLPKAVSVNDLVYSATINLESPIKVRITKTTQNSLLAEIIRLSEEVENKKNHYIRIADYLAKFYTPAVHLLAFITFSLWCFYFKSGWEISLMNATAVLIITCPCALALAVPIVQTIAISNFIKKGILVKSGEALEKLREIDIVVFDKTGSLTVGKPQLTDVFLLKNNQIILPKAEQKKFYLQLAASLAKKSKHPISEAILKSCDEDLLELSILEKQGFGLESNFENKILKLGRREFCGISKNYIASTLPLVTLSLCERDSGPSAESRSHKLSVTSGTTSQQLNCFMKFGEEELVFLFSDQIKTDASLVIEELKNQNKKIILLSGDSKKAVTDMAQKLEITEFYFEETPITKAEILQKLKSQNHKILMIGDGLNDAPSLALADVSISFANASDLSQNIADIIISGQKLTPIISVINSSKKAIFLMKENLFISLVYNLIALPFAMAGYVVPLFAAIAMSSSSLLVLLNSLRMNNQK